jgi:hypothetical protein
MRRALLVVTAALLVTGGLAEAKPNRHSPWWKVAVCEESGRDDPTYGYLGIYPGTWEAYGGRRFSEYAGRATWREQVKVANRIEGGHFVPDQDGCDGSW